MMTQALQSTVSVGATREPLVIASLPQEAQRALKRALGEASNASVGWMRFENLAPGAQEALRQFVFVDDGFEVLSREAQNALIGFVSQDDMSWSEEGVAALHWRLLQRIFDLSEARTPLDEVFDILHWVFSDADKEDAGFSFASCVKVVCSNPESPTQYFGPVDVEALRDQLQRYVRNWLRQAIKRYPPWVQEGIRMHPDWVEKQLDRNPQWLNEQVRSAAQCQAVTRTLFD
jgi:hypothetical protein